MNKQEGSGQVSIGDWGDVAAIINRREVVTGSSESLTKYEPVDADCSVESFLEIPVFRQEVDLEAKKLGVKYD